MHPTSFLATAGALAALLLPAADARAQMCTLDAGCGDGGADAGPSDGGAEDAGDGAVPDGGVSDASVPDGGTADGGLDAGSTPGTAACSCETALDSDGLIHVCTGSFDRDVCSSFSCEQGTPRAARCSDSQARLCCTMPARMLYSHLYEDCTHPNCERGFRAQCQEFGGTVSLGACDAPELPDDPDTETGESSDCSVAPARAGTPWWSATWLAGAGLAWRLRRQRRRALPDARR
jgi:MYXO-CTERM domain-containing protein